MAARTARDQPGQPPPPGEGRILDVDVTNEMQASFLEYAYSVIHSRALPDARDGLKPVQRRILFQMDEMRLRPDRPHVKSGRIVGDVMGKLHPHGDGAIYDALVRLAQPFTMRVPLVDGHGNFGSLDAGPAAYRYTEARQAPTALLMVGGLDEEVVDFVPTYDDSATQPAVLPAAFPNLLVNGSSGIAVGMATNIPPHNLVEVIGAARHLLDHPEASLDDLMRFVPGPDFPLGGKIIGLEGLREAYATGRGTFRTRATSRVENITPRRRGLVVTELPYLVGPEKVITRISEAVAAKRLQGVAAVADHSDLDGMRLVIEVKSGFSPDAVLEQLYRLTPLEETFGVNMVALVDGRPRTLGLKELIQVFLDHRMVVVRRRSEHRLAQRRDRLHLVDGLLIAMLDIDEVIQLIRTSDDADTAKTRLMEVFDLSDAQATYILELRLRRLTRLSRIELESERDQLNREIDELTLLLADVGVLRRTVSAELAEVAKTYGTPRRTILLEQAAGAAVSAAVPLEISDDPCWVLLSTTGLLARTASPEIEGGAGRAAHDALRSAVATTARGEVGAVTSLGRVVRVAVQDLPAIPATAGAVSLAGGAPVTEFVPAAASERVVGLVPIGPTDGLAVGTADGVVKRVVPERPANRDTWEVISLRPGDEVVGAALCADVDEVVFVTDDAQLLKFGASAVRPQGRAAGGMAGIRLAAGARVTFFGVLPAVAAGEGASAEPVVVVTVAGSSGALPGTEAGTAKVTPYEDYPGKGRATGGVRCHRFLRGEDSVRIAWVGRGPAKAAAGGGTPIDLPPATGRRDGSGTPLPAPVLTVGGGPAIAPPPTPLASSPLADPEKVGPPIGGTGFSGSAGRRGSARVGAGRRGSGAAVGQRVRVSGSARREEVAWGHARLAPVVRLVVRAPGPAFEAAGGRVPATGAGGGELPVAAALAVVVRPEAVRCAAAVERLVVDRADERAVRVDVESRAEQRLEPGCRIVLRAADLDQVELLALAVEQVAEVDDDGDAVLRRARRTADSRWLQCDLRCAVRRRGLSGLCGLCRRRSNERQHATGDGEQRTVEHRGAPSGSRPHDVSRTAG
jgi:DNA gyrase subunit A